MLTRQDWLYRRTSSLYFILICLLVVGNRATSTEDLSALRRFSRALASASSGVIAASSVESRAALINGTSNFTDADRHGFQRELLSTTTLPSATTVSASKLDGERRIKECHFVRTQGRLRAESTFKQLGGITLTECQTLCQNLPTCKSFSFGNMASNMDNGTTECLLAEKSPADDSNILRPRASTVGVGALTKLTGGKITKLNEPVAESDRFFLFEKTDRGCIEVSFECGASTILVSVQTSEPFNGLVYTDGTVDPGCIVDISDKTNFAISVPIEDLQCNSVYNGHGEFSNTIVVQWDKRIVTRKDRRFHISCQYELGDMQITHKPFEIQNLSPLSMTHKVPQPETFIRLLGSNGEEMQEASVGETTTFRIEIASKDSPYRIFARDCRAMGEREQEVLELIDAKGCPVYPEVFPALKQVGSNLEARFQTFRFRTSYSVTFTCTIDYLHGCWQLPVADGQFCTPSTGIDKCEPAKCDGGKLAMGRRRRRSSSEDELSSDSRIRRSLRILDSRPPSWNYSNDELFKVQEAAHVVELIRQQQQTPVSDSSRSNAVVTSSTATASLVAVTWILFGLACLFLIVSLILGVFIIIFQKMHRQRRQKQRQLAAAAAVIDRNPNRRAAQRSTPNHVDHPASNRVSASTAPRLVLPHGLNPTAFTYYEQALAPFTEEQRKHFYAYDQYAK